jgi:histidine triad (HIT) family protein
MPDAHESSAFDTDCIFCRIARRELPAFIIDESPDWLAILDIAPASSGHVLLLPTRHAPDLLALDAAATASLGPTLQRIGALVAAYPGATALTVVQSNGHDAWQDVPHCHFHLIPRSPGDTLTRPWSADTASPEQLAAVAAQYDLLVRSAP